MKNLTTLKEKIIQDFCAKGYEFTCVDHDLAVLPETAAAKTLYLQFAKEELTLVLKASELIAISKALRDTEGLQFEQLLDVCGLDYLQYGSTEWLTDEASGSGFERALNPEGLVNAVFEGPRFAVVYHLLSVSLNQRLRLKVFLPAEDLRLPSVMPVWHSADWFEREAFDLFGFLFEGHPDLRRILTDYGFIGHPFRKDFPVSGYLEMRYDKASERVIYQPVSIAPRVLVPKVIREDSRYQPMEEAHV